MYTLMERERIGRKWVMRLLLVTDDRQAFEFALWAHTRHYHTQRMTRVDGKTVGILEVR